MDPDQLAALSDSDLQHYVEGIAGHIDVSEENGQYAVWVHFKTERTLSDGRRKLGWHQKSGLGSSWREAMEYLAAAVSGEEAG